MKCRFCESEAIALFELPDGCFCFPNDKEQSLCMQHIVKANPISEMILKSDFTKDLTFTKWWNNESGIPNQVQNTACQRKIESFSVGSNLAGNH